MKIQNIIIIAIIAILLGVACAQPVGQGNYNILVAKELQNNQAAQEIAALGIQVTYEELGQDGNGYTVQGQTWYYVLPDGSEQNVKVILDDDIDPNSYLAHAVLYHELGHIVNTGAADTEAAADEYAGTRGYNIVDAYHGIH